jgi:hypothetical protein
MNGFEIGVDCGGSCILQCKNTYKPLKVVTASGFKNGEGKSDILVLLENPNNFVAPKLIDFGFKLYAKDGSLIQNYSNQMEASSYKYIPLLIKDYPADNIARIDVDKLNYDMYTTRGAYDIKLQDFKFENDNVSKLNVKIRSIYKETISDTITLVVLLKDTLGNVIGVNYKSVNNISPDIDYNFDFTWREIITPSVSSVNTIELIPISKLYVNQVN